MSTTKTHKTPVGKRPFDEVMRLYWTGFKFFVLFIIVVIVSTLGASRLTGYYYDNMVTQSKTSNVHLAGLGYKWSMAILLGLTFASFCAVAFLMRGYVINALNDTATTNFHIEPLAPVNPKPEPVKHTKLPKMPKSLQWVIAFWLFCTFWLIIGLFLLT